MVDDLGALRSTRQGATTLSRNTGQAQTFSVRAVDAGGNGVANVPVALTITGANPQQINATTSITGLATLSYTGANVGTDMLQAVAWVSGIAIYSGQVNMTWTPGTPPASPDPLAVPGQIGSPKNGSIISDTVPIVLASGLPSQTCTVDYWPADNPSAVTTLATNVAGSGGSTLANLDTTTLGNGSYVIRVRCTDGSGTQVQSGVLVTVVGENKPGRVRFAVTDLTVPVTGLPITIGRTYDSLEKSRSGDFGYGWSLSIGSPRLEVNAAHDVTVTQPNGQRVTFFFAPQSMGGVLGFFLAPKYTPEAGVYGSLTADGCPLLVAAGNGYVCFLDGAYQPTTYTYTDPYGRVFVMGADGTLQSITDLDQNKLTFGANGISSSAGGRSVTFVRDGQGRITQITDPAGKAYTYVYSTTGDLGSMTLPAVATPVKYGYDTSHLITSIVDPRGHALATATYYADGRLKDETDAAGNTTSYAYNLATNTTTTTYPDSGVRTVTYDGYGNTLSDTDPLMHTTVYQYYSDHNLKQRTDALGHTTSYSYDSNGQPTTVTGPLNATSTTLYNQYSKPTALTDTIGVTRTITYDANFMPQSITDKLSTRGSFTFDSHGSLKTLTNGNGKTTSYDYDQYGNLTKETDPLNHATTYTYDQMGRRLISTDALNRTTRYGYDALGNTVAITDALGFVTKYTYDGSGNKTSETDARNYTTTYIYDNANRLQYIHFPDTSAITYTYTFRGDKDTETDQFGRVTKYTYDKAGQLKTITYAFGTPDAATVSYDYNAIGERISETDARGNQTTTSYVYDTGLKQKRITITPPSPFNTNLMTSTFNAAGQRIKLVDANNHQTTYQYDPRGLLTLTTYHDGSTSQQSYYGDGNVQSRTDQASKTTSYTYYDDGQLHTVTNPANETTTYGYDPVGNLTSITDANNHTTSFQYNELHQRTKQILPITSISATYDYDPNGNLWHATDFNSKTTTYSYDPLNRVTNIAPDASLSGQTAIGFSYYPTGQRSTMSDASGTTSYTYDARDRLLSKATPQGTLSYIYDAASNVTTLRSSHSNGVSVDYSYDELNRLKTVLDNRLPAGANTTTYVYSPTTTLKSVTLPNGVVTNYGYDPLDRLTSLAIKQSSTLVGSFSYTLRPEGNRSQVVELGGRTVSYTYDNAYRLLSETISGGSLNGTISYSYDSVGNRLSQTSTVAGIAAASYSYDANDRLNGNSYDNNGNTTAAGGVTYTYDFLNRLTGATGDITLVYDGDGNRVQETAGGTTTQYLVDDNNPTGYAQVVEEISGGAVQRTYTYGHALISQTQVSGSPSTRYYGDDGLGSVRLLTDASGTKTDSYDYDAFGNVIANSGTTPNNYRFAGEQNDPNLGLYYLRARYYNTGSGRFWSRDTADIVIDNPVELNRYTYTRANPVNYRDPSGYQSAALPAPRSLAPGGLGEYAALLGSIAGLALRAGAIAAVGVAVACVYSYQTSVLMALLKDGPGLLMLESFWPRGTRCVIPILKYPASQTPTIGLHIVVAQYVRNKPMLLTYAGSDKNAERRRRYAACKDFVYPPQPGVGPRDPNKITCDEYPYATTFQGGEGSSTWPAPFWEQRIQGNILKDFYGGDNNQLRRLEAGDVFATVVIP